MNATLKETAMPRASTTPRNVGPFWQRQGNWEHFEVLVMIQCKKMGHLALRELVDLHF
jgi:hypothetical protein